MITAKEAWKQSKYYCQYTDYMERAECAINEAIRKGWYLCELKIPHKIDNEVKIMLVDELAKHGYLVVEEDHKDIGDPEPYFYTLCINWEHEGDE